MFAVWNIIIFVMVSASAVVYNKVDHLKGKHLIIATADLNPYMYLHHDVNGTIIDPDGIVHQMILWLTKRYDFTFHYVESPDGYFGAQNNGTWNGMVGMAVRKEVDLVATQLTTSYTRSLVIDFTTSFSKDPMSAIIPAPTQDSFTDAIIKPFQPDVWALIIFSMFAVTTATWIFMIFIYKYMPEEFEGESNLQFWENFMYFFGIISSQGLREVPIVGPLGHAIRIIAAVWGLASVVFIYLYSGCLTSFITIPKMRPIIESLEDLSTNSQLQLSILKDSLFETIILESASGAYKILGDSLLKTPENRLSNDYLEPEVFLNKAVTGRFAMVDQKSFLEYVLNFAHKKTGKCEVTLMKEEIVTSLDSMAVQKHSPYLAQIDQGFLSMASLGLQNYWEKRFLKKPVCEGNFGQGAERPRLNLTNLAGPFILLFAGLGFSCLVFLWEKVYFSITQRKQTNLLN